MFRPEALGSKANIRTGQSSDAGLVISEAEDILGCAEKKNRTVKTWGYNQVSLCSKSDGSLGRACTHTKMLSSCQSYNP